MAADDPEDDIHKQITKAISICDAGIVAGSTAQLLQTECEAVALTLEQIRATLRMMAGCFTVYDRPVRFIIPSVLTTLDPVVALLKQCSSSCVPNFAISTLGSEVKTLQNSLKSMFDDIVWIETLYRTGFRQDRRVERSKIRYTERKFNFIDQDLANAWCGILSLHHNPDHYKITAAKDLCLLVCGKKLVVKEGAVTYLLDLLSNTEVTSCQGFKEECARTLISLVPRSKKAIKILSTKENLHLIVWLLKNSDNELLIPIVDLISTLASTCEPAVRDACAYEGVTQCIIQILNRGLLDVLGMEMPSSSRVDFSEEGIKENPSCVKLKIACVEALGSLAKDSVVNCNILGRTSGLVMLVRLTKEDHHQLREMIFTAVLNVTEVAERNEDIKRGLFGVGETAKETFECLDEYSSSDDVEFKQMAIRAIGNLSTMYVVGVGLTERDMKETDKRNRKMIKDFVKVYLCHLESEVRLHTAVALGKFTSPSNRLHAEYAGIIVENGGIKNLLDLALLKHESTWYPALHVLCNLSYSQCKNDSLMQALAQIANEIDLTEEVEIEVSSAMNRLGRI